MSPGSDVLGLLSRQSIDQIRQHIVSQVIHKILHREEPFPATWASWRNNSIPTLRDGRRAIDKRVKGVTANFNLKSAQKVRLEHSAEHCTPKTTQANI
jgi:hypothetical protein